MDREHIRLLIQRENLKSSKHVLARQLVRYFEELCKLDEQLEGNESRPEELCLLEAENSQLEETIGKRKTELVEVEKNLEVTKASHQRTLDSSAQRKRRLETEIEGLREECKQIRSNIEHMKNKSAEKERLKRRKNEIQREGAQLQSKIYNLGEEYQKNSDLLHSLKTCVEQLEQLEKQMEETMTKIWADCKTDALDRLF